MLRCLTACILSGALAFAAPVSYAAQNGEKENQVTTTNSARRNIQTIVFAGLAGAVLGLSTLSFYGRPQDHLQNVPGGAAVGIIIGATYTTYKAAVEPKEFYSFHDLTPETWRLASFDSRDLNARAPRTSFIFSF